MQGIQHIQNLARLLAEENDPKKITGLIDELRDAAATYLETMPNQQNSKSAAGVA